jgi:resuscitation-promoting factor RpfB
MIQFISMMAFDMRLYHSTYRVIFPKCVLFILIILLSGCITANTPQAQVSIKISADGKIFPVKINEGSNVEQAINVSGLTLGNLDRVEPDLATKITPDLEIKIIRVKEAYTVEEVTVPFERRVLQTESLPEQETMLAQKGGNGLVEITYRHIYEDGVETTKQQVASQKVIQEAVPEIIMVGIQSPFSPIAIPGRLVYLVGGNAWMMEKTTTNRKLLISTGDLDGRIFTLSDNGKWLLFTRRSDKEGEINTLWALQITSDEKPSEPVDLQAANIIHFADWEPGLTSTKVVYSTVEPRSTAPGWQANNDLISVNVSPNGWLSKKTTIIEANSGGVYGRWGTSFTWQPGSGNLLYARPDGIGLVDVENATLTPIFSMLPLQTRSDWAWIPPIAWSPDGSMLYSVNHAPQEGLSSQEESPVFNLAALFPDKGTMIDLFQNIGMFAYPIVSPVQNVSNSGESYQVAFLQAIFPEQSDNSRYRLVVIDRDGSNQKTLFPSEGQPGLEPQQVVWSPAALDEEGNYAVALMYQGNIWFVKTGANSSETIQITGDGLTSRLLWEITK